MEGAGAQWTSWGEWGECSSTCGGGERSRWRRCTAGGASAVETLLAADLLCPGEGRETGECWRRPCSPPPPQEAPKGFGSSTSSSSPHHSPLLSYSSPSSPLSFSFPAVGVQLRSSGGGGEHQGWALGAFLQVAGEEREGAPLYRQAQDDGQGCILAR